MSRRKKNKTQRKTPYTKKMGKEGRQFLDLRMDAHNWQFTNESIIPHSYPEGKITVHTQYEIDLKGTQALEANPLTISKRELQFSYRFEMLTNKKQSKIFEVMFDGTVIIQANWRVVDYLMERERTQMLTKMRFMLLGKCYPYMIEIINLNQLPYPVIPTELFLKRQQGRVLAEKNTKGELIL